MADTPQALAEQAHKFFLEGDFAAAVRAARRGLDMAPNHPSLPLTLAAALVELGNLPAGLEAFAARALAEGYAPAERLSRLAWKALARQKDTAALLDFPLAQGIDWSLWDTTLSKAAGTELLLTVLRFGLVNHPGWEAAFTALRRAWLRRFLAQPRDLPPWATLLVALAEQCFHNEYVFAEEESDGQLLDKLSSHARTDAAAAITLAAWRPLTTAPPLPPFAVSIERQQREEPMREAELATHIRPLTPVAGGISEEVRKLYEENPYPRWRVLPRYKGLPAPLALPAKPRVLIAGAGSGLHVAQAAAGYPTASITAIDLSRRALAHGARKVAEEGLANVRFAQADIQLLDNWGERFDLIESVGVLQHMDNPTAALRILRGLMVPGGLMKLGLYSRAGRQDLEKARQDAARSGLGDTVAGIRAFRRDILAQGGPPLLRDDFYTLGTCRDLLFHVHEHSFDLLELEATIAAAGLEFLGIDLDSPRQRLRYLARFGDGGEELRNWRQLENEDPSFFGGMYRLWLTR